MGSSMAGETTALYRDHVIDWSKDLERTIDYIETRKDLDHEKLAYYEIDRGHISGTSFPRSKNASRCLC